MEVRRSEYELGNVKKYSREIGTFISDGSKNRYAFELIVENKPGIIFKIGELFSNKNVNIIHFTHSDANFNEAAIFVVGDFTGADISPEDIYEKLREEVPGVKEVKYAGKVGNYFFSKHLYPITVDGKRVVMFGPANITGLLLGLRRNLGYAAPNILEHIGFSVGEELYKYYLKSRDLTVTDLPHILELLRVLLITYGWGVVKKAVHTDGNIVFEVDDLWECHFYKKLGVNDSSRYVLGIFKGLFSSVFRKKVVVKETQCINMNGSTCRFEIYVF